MRVDPNQVSIAGLSDMGQRRNNNEDSIWHEKQPDGACLLIVADGVGGAAAGEIASSEAVARLRAMLSGNRLGHNTLGRLKDAIEKANRHVGELARKEPRYHGMATTVSAAVIADGLLYVGHVGDSRVYLVRGGEAIQLTKDHSFIAEAIENGDLTEQEAAVHPARKAIKRGVGIAPTINVDTFGPYELMDGDSVLLCSDGLTDVVPDNEIAGAASSAGPGEAAERLVALANRRGGPDNVSVVIARVGDAPSAHERVDAPAAPANMFEDIPPEELAEEPDPIAAEAYSAADTTMVGGTFGRGPDDPRAAPDRPLLRRPATAGKARPLRPIALLPVGVVIAAAVAALVLLAGGGGGGADNTAGAQPTFTPLLVVIASPSPGASGAAGIGVSPAATGAVPQKAQCADGSAAVLHNVESGDTGHGIAAEYDVDFEDLSACNGGRDLTLLSVGDPVKVPCAAAGCPSTR